MATLPSALDKAFLKFTEGDPDDCWLWEGSVAWDGYGQVTACDTGKTYTEKAHRLLYRYYVGEIESGKVLHHTCHNKLCVNPAHLDQLTHKEHMAVHKELWAAANPTCRRCGWSEWQQSGGARRCAECNRRAAAKVRAKKRAEKIK